MFEFRDRTDRRPPNGSVTILAGGIQCTVRTTGNILGRRVARIARGETCLKEHSQLKQQVQFCQTVYPRLRDRPLPLRSRLPFRATPQNKSHFNCCFRDR